jgi:hypothetical protein
LPWLIVLVAVAAGCTRSFFRKSADKDVEALLAQKSIDSRWAVDQSWYVYPDQRARFADFDKPDRPRKPPDDPAAAALSPDSQPVRTRFHSGPEQEGQGYLEFLRNCDELNRGILARAAADDSAPMATLGNPAQPPGYSPPTTGGQSSYEAALRANEPPFLITLEQALELSLFNSRDYQDRREDLYLAALPVTLQRFNFYPQLFAGATAIRQWQGSQGPKFANDSPGSNWSINPNGSVSQLLPTGATLVANVANQVVVDLGHGNSTVALSTLTLAATQPLLRGGGWAVTLEPLTQTERTLVYAVRSFAHYRKVYYAYLAGGTDLSNAPYSFAGLSLRGVGPSLIAPSQGYLPTLLTAALGRNERENLRALTGYLALYREYQGRGDFSELQVGQVEQQILGSQNNLLLREQSLQNGLDQFKLQLGIPTPLPLELNDAPAKPIREMLAKFTQARDEFSALRDQADRFRERIRAPLHLLAGSAIGPIPLEVPLRQLAEDLIFNSAMTRNTKEFRESIGSRWNRWQRMSTDEIKTEIRRLADELRDLEVRQVREETANRELPAEQRNRIAVLPRDIALGHLELSLRNYEVARKKKAGTIREDVVMYEEVVNNFMRVMNEARMERRSIIRSAWPTLPNVNVDGADMLKEDLVRAETIASQAALANRMELMNVRSTVVDAWRQITVQANSLLGVLNVGYNLNATSPPNVNEPLVFGGSRSTQQLVIDGQLPLVRRAERNAYRTALIAYQRARRNLQATEDFILNDVRTDIRTLRVLGEAYRIQQRAVEVAYDQVENSLDVLQAPPQPDVPVAGQAQQPGSAAAQTQQSAANAASLTQQLLNAQTSLVNAQNQLYTVWINYLIARMTFYRDIERLQLDPRGVWIDEPCTPTLGAEALPDPDLRGNSDLGGFADFRPAGNR